MVTSGRSAVAADSANQSTAQSPTIRGGSRLAEGAGEMEARRCLEHRGRRQDNVWVLHRPRTLKPEDAAMAAPPVMVFDAAGNFIKAWGGAGSGYEWPEREHGIHIDHKGFVVDRRQQLPDVGHRRIEAGRRRSAAQVHARRQVRHADRPQQSEQGQRRHGERAPRGGRVGASARPTSCSSPTATATIASWCSMRTPAKFKRMWGAFGNKPVDEDQCASSRRRVFPPVTDPPNFSVVHAIRVANDGMVYVADRENRRVQMFTADGKFVKQLVGTDSRSRAISRCRPTRSSSSCTSAAARTSSSSIARRSRSSGTIKVPGMIGAGHQIATDSKGNIYIAQTSRGHAEARLQGHEVIFAR